MRKTSFAGSFYSEDFGLLDKEIKDCFLGKLGPGSLPDKRREGNIKGVIVPHASYLYSGQCAAHAYKKIAESNMPEVFIILGTNHANNKNYVSLQDFQTPFGVVKNDIKTGRELIEAGFEVDNSFHEKEHSIEVQMPFLQFASKDNLAKLRIVPILIGHFDEKVAELIKNIRKDKIIIASTDLNHVGENYGFFEDIEIVDKKIVEIFVNCDLDEAKEYFSKNHSVCGSQVILTLLYILKTKGTLLKYYDSSEISEEKQNRVGYSSIVFN